LQVGHHRSSRSTPPRTAKSGSHWTQNELDAYDITFNFKYSATFFGINELPAPAAEAEIMAAPTANETTSGENYQLLGQLAMLPAKL